jgi:hypothetical protein
MVFFLVLAVATATSPPASGAAGADVSTLTAGVVVATAVVSFVVFFAFPIFLLPLL